MDEEGSYSKNEYFILSFPKEDSGISLKSKHIICSVYLNNSLLVGHDSILRSISVYPMYLMSPMSEACH